MGLFELTATLLTLAALCSYLNNRHVGLPPVIGLMVISLAISLGLILLGHLGFGLEREAAAFLARIDFKEALLHWMLGFLLFAAALHVELNDLMARRRIIAALATVGLIVSTLLVGCLTWAVLGIVGLDASLLYCLVFGALISPTDPIAVIGILKKAGASKDLETMITGESLFNDGVAVVVFMALLDLASGQGEASLSSVTVLFAREAAGGAAVGLTCGAIAYAMLKRVDSYDVEVLITLALAMGSYAVAGALHAPGPIAAVVAGLLTGNHGRRLAMSVRTREHLDTFWELVDETLNAVLFVLIGLEVLVLSVRPEYLVVGVLTIPVVLLARLVSVSMPVTVLRRWRTFPPRAIAVMTWGGLRGGISVALALALPHGPARPLVLVLTYAVVVFSIVVQGLTIERLVKRAAASATIVPPTS